MRSRNSVSQRKPTAYHHPTLPEAPARSPAAGEHAPAIEGADCKRDLAGSRGTARLRLIRARFMDLHERLLAGERAVADELCVLLAPELRRNMRPRDPRISPEFVEEAIDEALTQLVTTPTRCDPVRGDPIAWLVTIARNKLRDIERAARRRWRREVPLADEIARGLQSPVRRPDELAEAREWIVSHYRQLMATAKTAPERQFLAARVRWAPIADQAAALAAGHLPEAEQRALINRIWERLRLRLARSVAGGRRAVRPDAGANWQPILTLSDSGSGRRIKCR
jgi:DNA-directed RNA polymerase specialized sigma24 family protein